MTIPGSDRRAWKAAERARLAAERDLIRLAGEAVKPPPRAAPVVKARAPRKQTTAEQRRKWRRAARERERDDPTGELRLARKQSERKRIKNNAGAKARRRELDRARRTRKTSGGGRPFMGVDGEGAGTDDIGRQHYMLLRAGDRELYTGQPLTTLECLEFLCDCPSSKSAIMVGFSFGYDVTMILRDLPPLRRAHLLSEKDQGDGLSRYTYWSGPTLRSDGYGIEYLKNNYFRVCRTRLVRRNVKDDDGTWRERMFPQTIPGTSRTIFETFGFFQTSFLKTLKNFDIGTVAERAEIEANKAERGTVAIDQRQRDYCALECRFLGELMEQFREVCLDPAVNIKPRTWNGAGKLASALHTSWKTMTAEVLAIRLHEMLHGQSAGFLDMASAAYYGGRFEVTRVGAIAGPVWEYDIHSAYPAMMGRLPCLEHGTWRECSAIGLRDLDPACHLFVAPLRFDHHAAGFAQYGMRQNICGLPIRQKTGRLFWPVQGGGVYWSCEIAAAKKLGAQVGYTGPGWLYERQCDCQPFPHLEPLYEARKALGADLRGYPIKLAINGLYGKLAQRIGNPKFANLIWAGLITAMTRAALVDAAASDPEAVVMFATDGLFSLRPLASVELGEHLGQWEDKRHARLFIVQPGIYWGASRPKMRGVPDSVLTLHVERFESAWSNYAERDMAALTGVPGPVVPPVVAVPIRLFTGIRIAQARGKPETAGRWTDSPRNFDFAWHAKRGRHDWVATGEGFHVWTRPASGAPDLWSRPHAGDKKRQAELDLEKAELAEQADPVDLSIPWAE